MKHTNFGGDPLVQLGVYDAHLDALRAAVAALDAEHAAELEVGEEDAASSRASRDLEAWAPGDGRPPLAILGGAPTGYLRIAQIPWDMTPNEFLDALAANGAVFQAFVTQEPWDDGGELYVGGGGRLAEAYAVRTSSQCYIEGSKILIGAEGTADHAAEKIQVHLMRGSLIAQKDVAAPEFPAWMDILGPTRLGYTSGRVPHPAPVEAVAKLRDADVYARAGLWEPLAVGTQALAELVAAQAPSAYSLCLQALHYLTRPGVPWEFGVYVGLLLVESLSQPGADRVELEP